MEGRWSLLCSSISFSVKVIKYPDDSANLKFLHPTLAIPQTFVSPPNVSPSPNVCPPPNVCYPQTFASRASEVWWMHPKCGELPREHPKWGECKNREHPKCGETSRCVPKADEQRCWRLEGDKMFWEKRGSVKSIYLCPSIVFIHSYVSTKTIWTKI